MRKLPAAPSADQWAIANETSFSKGKVGGGKRSYYIAMVKILIIRFSSIGDIVLTSPVIRCLKKQLPECEIHFLVKEKFRSLVESNPYISTVHVLNGKITKVLRQLNEAGFDYVVDLQNNFRSALIRMALARNDGVVKKMNAEKWCMVNLKIKFTPTHIVHRYLQTVRNLGIADDGLGLDFFIPPADEIRPTELPLTHLHGFIAIVPGAAHFLIALPYYSRWGKGG
jgi:ADP-heptose:LPS heptosyltransferase